MKTEVVKRTDFIPRLTMIGTVRASESLPLIAVRGGRIRYAPRFRAGLQTGAAVKAGDLIAEITNTQSASLVRQARLQMEAAQSDFERADRSFHAGILSSAEHASYDTRRKLATEAWSSAATEAGKLRVVAPRAGRLVVSQVVAPGSLVEDGRVLAEITSGSAPVVETAAASIDREMLEPGLAVAFTARGGTSWRGTGRIAEVASTLDANGTARVVSSIDRSEAAPPVPGSGVELEVSLGRHSDALSVPEEAIVAGTDGAAVFVVAGATSGLDSYRVRRTAVETGGRGGGRIEVRSGLHAGDRVVVAGADALADRSVIFEAAGTSGTQPAAK